MKLPNKNRRIPINEARELAKKYGYDQIVIFAHKDDRDWNGWRTTWGKNKRLCREATALGKELSKGVTWFFHNRRKFRQTTK